MRVGLQGVSELLHGPSPDPAGLVEQGQDQQSINAEVEVEEDPSWDGLNNMEQLEAPEEAWGEEGGLEDVEQQKAWGEEGGLDVEAEQAPQDQLQAEAWIMIPKPSPTCHW